MQRYAMFSSLGIAKVSILHNLYKYFRIKYLCEFFVLKFSKILQDNGTSFKKFYRTIVS